MNKTFIIIVIKREKLLLFFKLYLLCVDIFKLEVFFNIYFILFQSALLIHLPYAQKTSDELLQTNPQQQLTCHPMDSNFTTDVLRYIYLYVLFIIFMITFL